MDPSQQTSVALINRTNHTLGQLLSRYKNIISLAPVQGRDRNSIAVDAYQIEVETTSLIRAAEELLSITRALKEAWLFGQLDTLGESSVVAQMDEDAKVAGEAFLRVMRAQESKSKAG